VRAQKEKKIFIDAIMNKTLFARQRARCGSMLSTFSEHSKKHYGEEEKEEGKGEEAPLRPHDPSLRRDRFFVHTPFCAGT
jgi:hypothetical protein